MKDVVINIFVLEPTDIFYLEIIMKRQKTLTVNSQKIKIVSRTDSQFGVRTDINGTKYFSNFKIMKDYKITSDHKAVYEEFIKRAMDRAYVEWVEENVK